MPRRPKAPRHKPEDWIDGPGLVKWLEDIPVTMNEHTIGNTLARRVREWRKGRRASVYTVDELLIRTGGKRYIGDIPKKLTGAPPLQKHKVPYPEKVRRWAVKQAKTRPIVDVAREIGCSDRAVRNWIQKAEGR